MVAQKALLVGIQDGHERHLGQVESLAQKVDAYEHVELAATQIAQDLRTLQGGDVRVHVARLHALIQQMVGQILGHLLRERRDEHAFVSRSPLLRLVDDVVDLAGARAHDDLRVQKARRADDLVHLRLAHALLVVARRGRYVDELRNALLELVEAQGAVVQAAGQTEAVFGQGDLAGAVALVHAADLRHRDVGLVDDAEEVLREVVDEGVGRLARRAAVQMPRVVLDAGAKSHGLQHLQVVVHAHLQALGLQELPLFLELHKALAQLVLNRAEGLVHLRARRNVVGSRPDGQRLVGVQHLAGDLVDLVDGLDLVPPELDADGMVGVGREHVQRIAPHAEGAALLLVIVAVVLDVDELVDDLVAVHLLLLVDEHCHAGVVHRRADTVDAAHRCHHDDIPPREQSRGRRMAQLLHLLVDGGVLLDEGVR